VFSLSKAACRNPTPAPRPAPPAGRRADHSPAPALSSPFLPPAAAARAALSAFGGRASLWPAPAAQPPACQPPGPRQARARCIRRLAGGAPRAAGQPLL